MKSKRGKAVKKSKKLGTTKKLRADKLGRRAMTRAASSRLGRAVVARAEDVELGRASGANIRN